MLKGTFAFAFLVCLGLSAQAQQEPKPVQDQKPLELTLAHTGDTGSIHDLTASEFARRVKTQLGGKVVINVVGASKLGNEAEMLEKVKKGEIAFSLPSPTLVKVDRVFAVFELPYLVLSRNHVKTARKTLLSKYFRPAAEAKGLYVLAMWENGFRHITNSVRPIENPKDLKDIKLRVSQGSSLVSVFKTYGANPQEFPFGQKLYDALKSGEFHGQENPFGNIYTAKIHEVQKYLSLTGHQYGSLYLVSGTNTWSKISKDQREKLLRIAEDLQDWSMNTGQQLEKIYRAKLVSALKINEVNTIAFLAASLPIYRDYAKEVPQGKELVRLLHDRTSFETAGANW